MPMPHWMTPDPVALYARSQPDRVACVDLATDRRWTYAELDAAIQRAVTVLTDGYGLRAGQRAATIARNSADLLILQQATMRIGAIFVPVNWRLSPAEQQAILADGEPALLVRDEAAPRSVPRQGCAAVEVGAFVTDVAAAPPAPRRALPSGDAPSIILYTSGTSGRPKGVILTERNALATAINFGVLGRVGNRSVFLCDSPMFHVIGLLTSLRPPLLQGATVLISSGFDAGATNRRLADPALGVTHYFCVPQMAKMLREQADFAPSRWTSLTAIFTGGAPNPAANIRWWLEQGIAMVDGYGMTEAGTVLGMPIDPQVIAGKAGAAGLAAPLLSIRLVGADERDVAPGEPGELWIAGPNVTPRYWNRADETANAFSADGWFRTGDIGRMDEDGFVTLIDRRKDMFISGGENVYPAEAEAALLDHPDIAEVAVIGVADAQWGEVGRAYVVMKPGRILDAAALASHCAARIARYKVPKTFCPLEALPRTASGKIQKHVLRAREAAGPDSLRVQQASSECQQGRINE
ncbi:acyl-CoA synthetase [Mesorhizobium sp. M1C.F.Ca.ET.193.01.1.1]|uniref:AMP-binding protein n=1 Tax=unclassified Mesorhizobium TaxID=325217 RepID=UPI000FD19D24|nr:MULTISPECIES: AMP-binding protein [unclassified Mesorhizobium]TGS92976.1 acyl-CoA synthetase [bacterium M00.F.Ca.ET.177.01.1.1]TGQ50496.1 acyl-CoA synthetase [Mesorhizobium sp. M1C.F.Ca.ET.210.01.1.1]TGQ65676.1 acyl-CoA synthetase [Mesorhizobium sp. M1C.F.Ca.ET.212.01.1.1]TGQ99366.1 acyl-CoA synthetase [Mesorhizobium sp. M1C.F.Ca.ET.204.01.1.1]TGR19669.1 acyl-CoA synthetase [Mesorhizobium sp. M1C.F.Ca.ET.196.01.1.1]